VVNRANLLLTSFRRCGLVEGKEIRDDRIYEGTLACRRTM
jgi:hypothetical protein